MAIIRWQDPVDMLPSFPNIFSPFFGSEVGRNLETIPSVNIRESKEEFVLEVAAPGLSKDSFEIEVNNNVLVISGKEEKEKEEEGEKWARREFYYSSFQRSFQLPSSVSADKIGAEYKDGVLFVKVPKKEEAKKKESKRIEVK